MANKICQRCFVSGRVQGVAFRYYTRQQAQRLGVSGWARNLADGRVEVLAGGEPSAVNKLCAWLHEGPPLAHVTDVQCTAASEADCPEGFAIQ
jgi:acylphosphatase